MESKLGDAMGSSDATPKKDFRLKTLESHKRSDLIAGKPLFRLPLAIKIVFTIILIFAGLLTGAVIYMRNSSESWGSRTAHESNLGNSIIMANALYTQLGGTFGKSTSETVKEMQKNNTFISFEAIYARSANSVGVFDLKCSKAVGCQEVELVSIDLASLHCFYVKIDKTIAFITTPSQGLNPDSQTIEYGSLPLKPGETTCSTSDKVSNWRENGFPPS